MWYGGHPMTAPLDAPALIASVIEDARVARAGLD